MRNCAVQTAMPLSLMRIGLMTIQIPNREMDIFKDRFNPNRSLGRLLYFLITACSLLFFNKASFVCF